MSKPKHTPGPWRAIKRSGVKIPMGFEIRAESGEIAMLVEAGKPAPGVFVLNHAAEANATLIAAAPEIIVALGVAAAALEAVASGFRYQGNQEMFEFYNGKAHEARAAIAKAEGRSDD